MHTGTYMCICIYGNNIECKVFSRLHVTERPEENNLFAYFLKIVIKII